MRIGEKITEFFTHSPSEKKAKVKAKGEEAIKPLEGAAARVKGTKMADLSHVQVQAAKSEIKATLNDLLNNLKAAEKKEIPELRADQKNRTAHLKERIKWNKESSSPIYEKDVERSREAARESGKVFDNRLKLFHDTKDELESIKRGLKKATTQSEIIALQIKLSQQQRVFDKLIREK